MAVHSRYLDIASKIRERIEAGEWEPGARLPRLDDFAAEYAANRDTIGRAVAVLEAEGLVWAVQGRGITVRYGTIRPRRPRGDLVKRDVATDSPGYSFPSASGQEVWKHRIPPEAVPVPLEDPRIASLLKVPGGSPVMRRFHVTGPESEPPFQINISWIHPRGAAAALQVAEQAPGPGDWLYRLEKAGPGRSAGWRFTGRGCRQGGGCAPGDPDEPAGESSRPHARGGVRCLRRRGGTLGPRRLRVRLPLWAQR